MADDVGDGGAQGDDVADAPETSGHAGSDSGSGQDLSQLFATEDGPGSAMTPEGTDAIYQLLRQMGLLTAPGHQSMALQGLQSWQQQAQGSPSALAQQMMPQIRQLREQLQTAFQGVSKRLGPMGGKQIDRDQGALLSQGGLQLGKLFTGAQQQGTTGLMKFLQNLRPALLAQLPQLQTQTQEQPFNYGALGQALASGAGVAGQLWPQGGGASMAALNPNYGGFTAAQSAPLSDYGSGYGSFSTYGV